MLGDEDSRWQAVEIRARRYLNNIVEQDHRAIKRRCVSMLGLKSFRTCRLSVRERDTKQHANGSLPELTQPSNDGNCGVCCGRTLTITDASAQ